MIPLERDIPDLLHFSSSSLERHRVDGKPLHGHGRDLPRTANRSGGTLPDGRPARDFNAPNKHTDYEFLLISGLINRKQKFKNLQKDDKSEGKNNISIQTLKRYKRPKNRRNRLRAANVILIATTPHKHSSVAQTLQKGFAKPHYDVPKEYAKSKKKHRNLMSIEMEKNAAEIDFDRRSLEDVARADATRLGNDAKSRLKISGCLGLIEPGKLVLHCRATIDDREVLTACSDPVDVNEIHFTPALKSYALNKIVQTVHIDQAGAKGFQNNVAKIGAGCTLDVASQCDSYERVSKELCVIDDHATTVLCSGLARRSILLQNEYSPILESNESQNCEDTITLDRFGQGKSKESTSRDTYSNTNYTMSKSTQSGTDHQSFSVGENVKIKTGEIAHVQTDKYLYSNEVGTNCNLAKKAISQQFVSREVDARGISSVKINIQSNNENYNVSYRQNNDKKVNLIVTTKRNNLRRDDEESVKPFYNNTQNNHTVARCNQNNQRPKTAKFTRTPIVSNNNISPSRSKNSTPRVSMEYYGKSRVLRDPPEKPYTPRDGSTNAVIRSFSNENKAEVIYKSERIEADLIYKKPVSFLAGNFSAPSSSGRTEITLEGPTKRLPSIQKMSDSWMFNDDLFKYREDTVKPDEPANIVSPSQTSTDSICDIKNDCFVKLKPGSVSNHHGSMSSGMGSMLFASGHLVRSESNSMEKGAHYRGDHCAYVDPLQRDLEIQALLGIQRQFSVRMSDEKVQCDKTSSVPNSRNNQDRMSPSVPTAFPRAKLRNKKLQCSMVSEQCEQSQTTADPDQRGHHLSSSNSTAGACRRRRLSIKDMGLTVMSNQSMLSETTQSIISDSHNVIRKDSSIQHYSSRELQTMNDLLHLTISSNKIENQRISDKTSNLHVDYGNKCSKSDCETSISVLGLTNLSLGNEISEYDKCSINIAGASTQRTDFDENIQNSKDENVQILRKASDQKCMIKPITLTSSEYKFLKYSILRFVGMDSKSKHRSLSKPWQSPKQVVTVNYMISQQFSHRRPRVINKRKLIQKKNAINHQRLHTSSNKSLPRQLPKRLELPDTSYTIIPTDRIKNLLKTAREAHGDVAPIPRKQRTLKLAKAEDMIRDDTSNKKQQVNLSWALTKYRSVDTKVFEETRGSNTPQCESLTSMVANQDVHNSSIEVLMEPKSMKKKSFLKKLVTCLQLRSKTTTQKSPEEALLDHTQLTEVTSLNDSYRINSSIEVMNISSSLFDTSPSEFSLHSVDSLYVRQKTVMLNATRRLLSSAKPSNFPFGK